MDGDRSRRGPATSRRWGRSRRVTSDRRVHGPVLCLLVGQQVLGEEAVGGLDLFERADRIGGVEGVGRDAEMLELRSQ